MSLDDTLLEQYVGKKIELYDPRKNGPLLGVVLYAPSQERSQYVVAYRAPGGFHYRLLLPHLLSLLDQSESTIKMNWEFVEIEGRYENGNRTFLLGLEALFEKAGLASS
jgi:hypothetical protein